MAFSVCVALELLAAISRSKTFFYAQNKQNSKGGCSSIRPTPSRFQCCMVNCLHTNRNKHVPRIRLLVIFSIKTRQKKTFHLTLSWSTRSVQTRLQTKKEPTFALMTNMSKTKSPKKSNDMRVSRQQSQKQQHNQQELNQRKDPPGTELFHDVFHNANG